MKFEPIIPPRTFRPIQGSELEIKDTGRLALEADEQITLTTESGSEYDVARKSWGFYATPSMNGRLKNSGLRAALVRNRFNKYYVMLVEEGKDSEFNEYVRVDQLTFVCWLCDDAVLQKLSQAVS